VASYPSDELAERRARRDGRNVVFIDGRPVDPAEARLAVARHDVAVLQARVGETVGERDRMSALAATRREQLGAAREREAALRARLRVADGEVSRVRGQLAARAKSEASLRVEATGLHARIHALRAHAAGHDARVREVQVVVDELTGVTGEARADVERQLAARETAEEALAAERARAAELEDELASARAELEGLHAARDRTLGAEERVRAARAAELAALRVSSERLRPVPAVPPGTTLDLAVELARAAERLRAQRAPEDDGEPPAEPLSAHARSVASVPALPPAAIPLPRAPARSGGLRGLLHRLLAGRG
jgi:DNA repair exonuclease SbcCD ATPase subunit